MRKNIALWGASLGAISMVALATASLAQAPQTLGSNSIVIDGYRYGGQLAVGADKNLDVVRVLIKATDAMGQLRANHQGGNQWLLLGDSTSGWLIDADGKWNGVDSHVKIGWDYRIPGVRLDVTSADGKTRAVTVAANDLAWDEKTPGIFGGKAGTSVAERLIVPYLMPSAVAILGRDAAPTVKLSKVGSRNVLTIPVPKLGAGTNLVATLDAEGHPVHTAISYNGHEYTGDFSDFLQDRMDFMVYFPHHLTLKVDGKETANLDLNWHQADPYLIFPVPKEVAAK